jgi:hypothetical protein
LANGDTLTVSFVDHALAVRTSFGKVELAVEAVRKLTVSATGGIGGHRAGLVARWTGENGGKDSAGSNDAELHGITFADDRGGRVFCLNGVNSYLIIPVGSNLDVGTGDGFTMEGWIKLATIGRSMIVIEYERTLGTSDGSDVGILFFLSQPESGTARPGAIGANVLDVNQTSHCLTSPVGSVTAGVWQHIALSYDRLSGLSVLYANGTAVSQSTLGSFTPQTSFPNMLIGARTTFGSAENPRDAFSGRIREIGIYNRALSPEEVREDYEGGNKN